ncbi:MAG: hypothetical protein AABX11_00545 [Nanoarchaeota archaeon]
MITIDDLNKIEMTVGQISSIEKDKIKIKSKGLEFTTSLKMDVRVNEKIIIAINGNNLLIPMLKNNIPIIPEKDIEAGSKIR